MKEIPIPYIRAHQWGVVIFFLIAVIAQQPSVIYILSVIQVLTLLFGSLFVQVAKPVLQSRIAASQTQAAELSNFNNTLGMAFLTLSLVSFASGSLLFGYIFSGMFAGAAFVAICGYCVGCTIYFQIKQLRARM